MSHNVDNLKIRLENSRLRLEFANNFLKELQSDNLAGPEHDEAFQAALRAVAAANAEHARLRELFTKAAEERSQSRGA